MGHVWIITSHITHECNYLSITWSEVISVSKREPRWDLCRRHLSKLRPTDTICLTPDIPDSRLCKIHVIAKWEDSHPWWQLLSQFPPSLYFLNFSASSKYTLAIECHIYIDRWHYSSDVKYKCDSNNLTGTFVRTKILLIEKLINRALVTPTPGLHGPMSYNSRPSWQ